MEQKDTAINVEFITPQGDQRKIEACSIQVKTPHGKTEILRNHAPFFALLEPGTIKITPLDKKKGAAFIYLTNSGVIEVYKNHVVILADNGFFGEDLDPKALGKSEAELRDKMNTSPELLSETLKKLNAIMEKLRITEEIRESAKRSH